MYGKEINENAKIHQLMELQEVINQDNIG